jgi:hypothetical protein
MQIVFFDSRRPAKSSIRVLVRRACYIHVIVVIGMVLKSAVVPMVVIYDI